MGMAWEVMGGRGGTAIGDGGCEFTGEVEKENNIRLGLM